MGTHFSLHRSKKGLFGRLLGKYQSIKCESKKDQETLHYQAALKHITDGAASPL